jgi:hypothetical protein
MVHTQNTYPIHMYNFGSPSDGSDPRSGRSIEQPTIDCSNRTKSHYADIQWFNRTHLNDKIRLKRMLGVYAVRRKVEIYIYMVA